MPDLTARITEIQREHWQLGSDDEWVCVLCGSDFHTYRTHREHLSELIAQAAEEHFRLRIETVEQLDARPVGTVVRTDDGRVAEKTGEHWGKNASGYGSWWNETSDEISCGSDELDDLPVRVIDRPERNEP